MEIIDAKKCRGREKIRGIFVGIVNITPLTDTAMGGSEEFWAVIVTHPPRDTSYSRS